MRFVLIHGGFHGAWCWNKLTPELESLGHEVVAIDLPGAGERVREQASLESWRAAMRDVVEDGDVLVGHSMGGFLLALAADEVPEKIARLIFLSAAVPIEGQAMTETTSVDDYWSQITGLPMEEFLTVADVPGQGPSVVITNPEAANQFFYHDCDAADQAWAFERLTPLPLHVTTTQKINVPRFWSSPIPRDFIVCTDDRSHPMSLDNEFMARLGLTSALGLPTSHSPFVSQPRETAKLLDVCAAGTLQPGRGATS
jgi:pimeloyl-ACP methyl ester carboxylesterase